jgi:leucyl aminopeptidase
MGKNRYGGASTAAAFLLCFVEKGTKWVHIDIAGPAMSSSAKPPICADQTGFGVALLLKYILMKS